MPSRHPGRALRAALRAGIVAAWCVTVGCDGAPPAPSAVLRGAGLDAVLIRLPAEGGIVAAYSADADSILWRSRMPAPPLTAVLGFDEFSGLLLARDTAGHTISIDLRLGSVDRLGMSALRGEVRSEGAAVFGQDSAGRVVRVTPVATWSWAPPEPARHLVPLPDGALLVVSEIPGGTAIRRLIPPETRVTDSTELPTSRGVLRTAAGDRLWVLTDGEVLALRTRDLTPALAIPLGDPVSAIESTPSGDRLFLASDRDALRVIDRFAEREQGRVSLPAPATALRMDPDGAYLLVRTEDPAGIHVVAIGTMRVVATVPGEWRDDLPAVTPQGQVIVARDGAIVILDIVTGREVRRIPGGATDRWQLLRWNGFRPRAAGLDRPVEFEEADSAVEAAAAAVPAMADAPTSAPAASTTSWTLSFATVVDQGRAREMARAIVVEGRTARVVIGDREGTPIYRVLLGPYPTRDGAERAGMLSGRAYWVFEGTP
ncbi:MAG: hypothetical protein RL625_69 [Gemmatimonadota bacterium]|jgi:hypothetical protein